MYQPEDEEPEELSSAHSDGTQDATTGDCEEAAAAQNQTEADEDTTVTIPTADENLSCHLQITPDDLQVTDCIPSPPLHEGEAPDDISGTTCPEIVAGPLCSTEDQPQAVHTEEGELLTPGGESTGIVDPSMECAGHITSQTSDVGVAQVEVTEAPEHRHLVPPAIPLPAATRVAVVQHGKLLHVGAAPVHN